MRLLSAIILLIVVFMPAAVQAQTVIKIEESAVLEVDKKVKKDTVTVTKTYTCDDGRIITVQTFRTKTKHTKYINKQLKEYRAKVVSLTKQKQWIQEDVDHVDKELVKLQSEIDLLETQKAEVKTTRTQTIYPKKK